jgi:hypothetical protein
MTSMTSASGLLATGRLHVPQGEERLAERGEADHAVLQFRR